MKKIAVVGAGIGGILSAAFLRKKGYHVDVFEKSNNLGGCSGSFIKEGKIYNVGATTFPGLKSGYIIHRILEELNIKNDFEILQEAMIIHIGNKRIVRYIDLERTIEEINKAYPSKKHANFWKEVKSITEFFLRDNIPVFNFRKPNSTLKFAIKSLPYAHYFFIPARMFLSHFYGSDLSKEYIDFIRAHVLITAQTNLEEVNTAVMLFALGYPFTGIAVPDRPMSSIFERLSANLNVYLSNPVKEIRTTKEGYLVIHRKGEELYDAVVAAFPFLEREEIFQDERIRQYLSKYKHRLSTKGACVLYGVLKNYKPQNFYHAIVKQDPFNVYFVSFMKPEGEETTFTMSMHVPVKDWINLDRQAYLDKKEKKIQEMKNVLREYLGIEDSQIKTLFLSTPLTFNRYLGRITQGGIPISMKNPFWRIPPNFTKFKNLFLVGDMSFAYQGWLGVGIGVWNLKTGLEL